MVGCRARLEETTASRRRRALEEHGREMTMVLQCDNFSALGVSDCQWRTCSDTYQRGIFSF
jgi:hypothetical protein